MNKRSIFKYLLLHLPATAQCRVMETVSPAAAGAPLRLGFQLSAPETPVIASYTSWPERKNACLELEIVHLTIITLDVGPLRHLGMSLFIRELPLQVWKKPSYFTKSKNLNSICPVFLIKTTTKSTNYKNRQPPKRCTFTPSCN